MGYWGWRTLVMVITISVWITGCTLTTSTASSIPPTDPPPITLTVRKREPTALPATPTHAPATTIAAGVTAVADAGLEVYIVRPGDTLLGIALDFGLPLESLRAANPDVNPRQLQLGQTIHVPPASFLPPPTSTPAVMLALDPPTCYELPTGQTLCLGQVTNTLLHPVEHIRVRVQVFDVQNQQVREGETSVAQSLIPPGQSAPYRLMLDMGWETHYYASASLQGGIPAQDASRYAPLMVENIELVRSGDRYQLQGLIVNPTEIATEPVNIILTFYDLQKKVVAFRASRTAVGLGAGESQPIRLDVTLPGSVTPISQTLYVEARRSLN